MKTKLLLTAAVIGAASLSAQAGVHVGFWFGLPVPVFAAPVPPPAPVVVVAKPACPGPDYVWVDGYWGYRDHRRVWVEGSWAYRPTRVVYTHSYDRDHGYYRDHDHDRAGWHR